MIHLIIKIKYVALLSIIMEANEAKEESEQMEQFCDPNQSLQSPINIEQNMAISPGGGDEHKIAEFVHKNLTRNPILMKLNNLDQPDLLQGGLSNRKIDVFDDFWVKNRVGTSLEPQNRCFRRFWGQKSSW